MVHNTKAFSATGSVFTNNTASRGGGAVAVVHREWHTNAELMTMHFSNFTGNRAADGGALWLSNTTAVKLTLAWVTGNSASRGGGVFVSSVSPEETLWQAIMENNTAAAGGGGAFYFEEAPASMLVSSPRGVTALNNAAPSIACGPAAAALCTATCSTPRCMHGVYDGCTGFGMCVEELGVSIAVCYVEPRFWTDCGKHGSCELIPDLCDAQLAHGQVVCRCDANYHSLVTNHTGNRCAGVDFVDCCTRDSEGNGGPSPAVIATVSVVVSLAVLLLVCAGALGALVAYRTHRQRSDAAGKWLLQDSSDQKQAKPL
eukprot:TRINITY_DN1252_c0_g1_i2.p2 TRINITY_DN1252_c0_g1~~TRINITY_DN1252_c0_g1_i2.p2  ORF type:complete len:315 (-),score=62.46 TRINITY_DN1252_c0_g1_i2:1161-2105(-)